MTGINQVERYLVRHIISVILVGFLAGAFASEKNPSIMFKDQPDNQNDLIISPTNQDDELLKRCAEMSHNIDELRGKPQRRYILIKRYEIECKGEAIDYNKYDNHGVNK